MAKALSIRQPWASLIVHGFKTIENRTWKFLPKYRGELFIHASSGMTGDELEDCEDFCRRIMDWNDWVRADSLGIFLPKNQRKDMGGIIGKGDFVDIIEASDSPWFFGKQGLVIQNAKPLEFMALKGQLGIFEF